MKYSNIRNETMKLLEENIVCKLLDTGLNNVLDLTLKVKAIKEKINKQDYIKLNSFFTANNQQN